MSLASSSSTLASIATACCSKSLIKILALLILLPSAITYVHLRYNLNRHEQCFVGPPTDVTAKATAGAAASFAGIDEGISRSNLKSVEGSDGGAVNSDGVSEVLGNDNNEFYGMYRPAAAETSGTVRTFQLVHRPHDSENNLSTLSPLRYVVRALVSRLNWPSVASISTALATPTSSLLRHDGGTLPVITMDFDPAERRWCLISTGFQGYIHRPHDVDTRTRICSEILDPSQLERDTFPPSGLWKQPQQKHAADLDRHPYQTPVPAVRVSCPGGITITGNKSNDRATSSDTADTTTTKHGFRRNPSKANKKQHKQNKNVQQILQRPATTILLCFNIYLAFLYWNNHTAPSSIAKIYSKIIYEHELWRSYTGATAHFEFLHLSFNMMSLYSLGMELEESMGSIPFLLYNLALIPVTTIIMMGLIYLRIRYTTYHQSNAAVATTTPLAETSTVGYSGVLFAWMVVVSLERPITCPVPFLPEMCFETYPLLGGLIKVNVSPVIQLLVAQFIMPRVSFVGHLAGIIAGFLLHWNLSFFSSSSLSLLDLLWNPMVLVPGLLLVHFWYVRKIIPIPKMHLTSSSTTTTTTRDGSIVDDNWMRDSLEGRIDNNVNINDDDVDGDDEEAYEMHPLRRDAGGKHHHGGSRFIHTISNEQSSQERQRQQNSRTRFDYRRIKLQRLESKHLVYVWTRNALAIIAVLSFFVFDVKGSMIISQILPLLYFHYAVRSNALLKTYTCSKRTDENKVMSDQEKTRLGTLWRGCILSLILVLVADSMTFPAWMVAHVYIAAERELFVGLIPAMALLLIRIIVNVFGLVIATSALSDIGETGGGAFVHVFGLALKYGKAAGDKVMAALTKRTTGTAYEGHGIRLGGGT